MEGNTGVLRICAIVFVTVLCRPAVCQRTQSPVGDFRFTRKEYNATIMENSQAKTYVKSRQKMGIYITSDLSASVKYSIVDGDPLQLFKAEQHLVGDFYFLRIRTKGGNTYVLNREVTDSYKLRVKAEVRKSDSRKLEFWADVFLAVQDMNDLRPLFSPTSYYISVSEDTPIRSSIAQVTATDADIGTNGEFYYSFSQETDTFAIHPASGVVSLTRQLDYNQTPRYELTIIAEDRGLHPGGSGFSSTSRLQITVVQDNVHAPDILVRTLPMVVEHNAEPLTYAIITVTDKDSGRNGNIQGLEIIKGNEDGKFQIQPGSSQNEYAIKVLQTLDRETTPNGYNLTLRASDKGQPPKFSEKVVFVQLMDTNDHAPVFSQTRYEVTVSEFAPVNTPVVMVQATDPDTGRNAEIVYDIQRGNNKLRFGINSITGLIYTKGELHREERASYELTVVATDRANPSNRKKNNAVVVINIEDANDHDPVFNDSKLSANINENEKAGTWVLEVSAYDLDSGENGYLTYSLANVNPVPFEIDHFNGWITTTKELDYEMMPQKYMLRVRASDWGSPYRRETEMTIPVKLQNMNDNIPQFEKVKCEGTLSRDAPIGQRVHTLSAIDDDPADYVRYEILSGNDNGLFELNPTSGDLTLARKIGQFEPSFISLKVTATDGDNQASPVYLNMTVTNNMQGNDYINLQCQSTGVAQEHMRKVQQKSRINALEEDETMHFSDIHTVNLHSPEIDSGIPREIDIGEDSSVGTVLATVNARDSDTGYNGMVVYVIAEGNTDSCFTIGMQSGKLSILSPLDRERTESYILNITATDLGNPRKGAWKQITINVMDANDNKPRFSQDKYEKTVDENIDIGSTILQVYASDPDSGPAGTVRYSLLTGTEKFSINEKSGVIKTTAALDREEAAVHSLRIQASDQDESYPLSSVVTVTVTLQDLNDNAPKFIPENYKVKVREDLPKGAVILMLEAQDPDEGRGGEIRYSLQDGDEGKFDVDRLTGVIRLVGMLDFEDRQVYNITARAKDKGSPQLTSTCKIEVEVIDINENLYAPEFPSFVDNGTVYENEEVGTEVLQVVATDLDSGNDGKVVYSIRDGSGLGRFVIDDEGIIRTAEVLDRETESHYWLTVYAQDRAAVPLYNIIEVYIEVLDVNDNAPLTEFPIYYPSVDEGSGSGKSVAQVSASDPDEDGTQKLTFKITSGNPQGFFQINQNTGLITTTSRRLDREQQAEHILEVSVSDNGSPPQVSTAHVVVSVADVNDNSPDFGTNTIRIRVPERNRTNEKGDIYRVVASDDDVGSNGDLAYSFKGGNDKGRFFIDPTNGMISTRKALMEGQQYTLKIQATDHGRPQRKSKVNVVIDVVKPPVTSIGPKLKSPEPEFNYKMIQEDWPVKDWITVVEAEDPDSPELWYNIIGGNVGEKFTIGNDGILKLAKKLDWEERNKYNLTVEVTDGHKSATKQILLSVIDLNDNRPQFAQKKYEVEIPEEAPIDTLVTRVTASDVDENSRLFYSIDSSTDPVSMQKFRINPRTGEIYTASPLDHETKDQHILTIMAKDQDVSVMRNFVRVVINVKDSNDHRPIFSAQEYTGGVYETAAYGTSVVQVVATDRDRGANSELTYTIETGNVGNVFSIDETLGIITVSKQLDRSALSQYHLTVKVRDNGNPPLSSTVPIHIGVTISNNAPPKFDAKEYAIEVSENARLGSLIVMLGATSRSSVTYEIISGNTDGSFDVNPNSGVITCKKQLDYERQTSYNLTVQATNMVSLSSTATVLVHIADENDNPPVFSQSEYIGSISEAATIGSVVLDVNNIPLVIAATDADNELNSLLVYEIIESAAQKYFAIDSNTGALRTIRTLDHEDIAEFRFTVQVSDTGNPPLKAENPANVTIKVLDVNDSPPTCTQDIYEATLLLPTYKDVAIVQVEAEDADTEANTQLTYVLTMGNEDKKFSINRDTGVITIVNTTGLYDRYELSVRVGDGKFHTSCIIRIEVKRTVMSGLRFTEESYFSEVTENSTEVKTVAIVTAIGNLLNEPLEYKILNPNNMFEVSPTSGVLRTRGIPFDREEKEKYEIVIEVRDKRSTPRVAHVVVYVTIADINDNAPVFVNLPYYSVVQVDAEPGTPVRTVTAVDKDEGKNSEIRYSLDSGAHRRFRINRKTGQIMVKQPLEAEDTNKEYRLLIIAEDKGNPPLSARIEVPVTVMNKAMPVFEKPFYAVSIPENVQLHTPVINIKAASPDGLKLIYSITDGDPFNQFNIDFDTGVINVVGSLDYETKQNFRLTVRATDSRSGVDAEVVVDITVQDINDVAPVFEKPSYEATLSEAAAIGTTVIKVSATDLDSGVNQLMYYQILQDETNSTDYFHIDTSSGLILTARNLDHEKVAKHDFTVQVSDGGMPSLSSEVHVTVTVLDLNDNAPQFDQPSYDCMISELAPRGHFVTKVSASDADSTDNNRLVYAIVSGNEQMNFVIDQKTGIIAMSNLRKRELDPTYTLNVSVSDGVFTSSARVAVMVQSANTHSPVFSQLNYAVSFDENNPRGTFVVTVTATDEDAGPYGDISYSIASQKISQLFEIDADTGKMYSRMELDREDENQRMIIVPVVASDQGGRVSFCNVTVTLTDKNDNTPQFELASYQANIPTDADEGAEVIQVHAIDQDIGTNSDIAYSLYDDSDTTEVVKLFRVHSETGIITTRRKLTGKEGKAFQFFVQATDGGNPTMTSSAPVEILILGPDDIPPYFDPTVQHLYFVSEEMPVDSEVATVVADTNDTVKYSIVEADGPNSNKDNTFRIDSENGVIYVNKELDTETTAWYSLKVQAETLSSPPLLAFADVSIQVKDANDNKPKFDSKPYKITLPENASVGTSVIQVHAFDPDQGANGEIVYGFASDSNADEMSDFFTIDSESGWVTTLVPLDRELMSSYAFGVTATDKGEPKQLKDTTLVHVTVADVNDSPPTFRSSTYHGQVREDALPGTIVITVSTRDADIGDNTIPTYYITGGDPQGQFNIERKTGKVYVNGPLDRETKQLYVLNITATDGAFTAMATVNIDVQDVNDNSPICEQSRYTASISEDITPQTFVMEVLARDPDQGIHSQITYSLNGTGADKFLLDKDTGVLMTGAPLDREETPVYTLGVLAKDGGGKSCFTELTINLIDVNDNPPKFEKQQYLVPVYENTAVGTLLTRVQATDPDMGLNRKVMYSFVDSASGQFQVDENSGIVSLARTLDREAQASFNLTIRATDEGAPRRSSTSFLIISVLDINDNPPEFEFAEYAKNVSESTPSGTQILSVYAVSKDVGPNAEITYEIISGNEHGKFEIDKKTGKISIVKTLDYEASQGYYLTVKASDGGMPTLSDITTVSINVTDVNDNAPEFSMKMYSASISEDAHTGDSVIQVMATDRDSAPNAQVTYTIVRGDPKGQFDIAPKLGIITVRGALDREEVQAYSLTVRAKDSGTPVNATEVVVNVDILDINDSPPQFAQGNYSVFVQESKPIGTSILMFTVKDFDAPQNGPPYTFSIISGNQGNEFHIDRSGILRTSVVFQSDMRRTYNLQVRVADAGTPSLYGYTNVVVEVIEESMYPPVVTGHQISISSFQDNFPGGVIGKLHATDNDMYDKLTYSLVSNNKRLFGVNPNDGKIIAQPGLDVGEYTLNISVSDGKFITAGEVSVTVKLVTDEMLRNSVTIRFANIQPEEFLSSYQKEFFRTLRRLLKVKNKNIIVVSMQPLDGNLDVLFCIETTTKGSQKEDYYKATALRRELNQTVMDIQQNVGLMVLQIISDSCSHNKCPEGACRDILNLDIHAIAAISTAKISFVSPRHMRDYECKCPGGLIGKDCNPCNSNPCPRYKMCLQDPKSIEGYECVCPDGTSPPNCNQLPFDDKGPMTFGGNSYIRYTLANSVDQMSTHLSLAILPRSPNGKIMYARGEYDYSILELINGYLQYRFNCGSGEGKVTMEFGSGSEVTDGKWHYVEVSRNGAYAELKLDHKYIARGSAAGENKILNLDDNDIYFGAEVSNSRRKKRAAVVSNGYLGCMDDMMLNGERLPRAGANRVATLRDMTDVDFNCNDGMETLGVCGSNPCMNGGSCAVVSPSNRYICNCLPRFSGDNCQIDTQPCNSNPCKNGARCKNLLNDFECACPREWYGKRCEHSTSCNCFNGATCSDTPSGKTCNCPENFTGEKCQEDVNECSRNPCQNGATCHNTEGSYFCNCTANTNGLHCENIIEMIMPKIESNSINIGLEEIIGIICCIIFLLLLVIIFVMVRRCRQRRKRNPHMSDIVATGGDPNGIMMTEKRDDFHRDAKMVHIDTNLDDYRPPLPARPISYTPSLCGNSLNNLSDGAMGAEVEPVFSSSTDMLAVRNKNPAIVCSVAPTLPPPPPSNSASDSDSIQKPAWEFECPNVVEGYVESKVNDADAVMNNIANDEMQVYRNEGGSMTDMVSLSSLPSESCDEDNMPDNFNNLDKPGGYHWDCSDWMPSSNLPNITEVPMCEMPDSSSSSNNHSLPHQPHPHNLQYDPNVYSDGYQGDPSDYTDHEYVTQYPDDEYGAGESDFPPPPPDESYLQYPDDYQDGFAPIQPPSNMPVPEGDHMYRPQHYHPNQYLPAHHLSDDQLPMTEQEEHDYVYPPSYQESMSQLPPGYEDYGNGSEYNADYEQSNIDDVSVSMYTTSNASVSDLSGADMDESEVALSDYESGGEGDNEGSQGNPRSMPQNDLHTEV